MAEHLLSSLLDGLSTHGPCPPHFFVHGLSQDSRTVCDGDLYLATRGARAHGLDFLPQALERGARAVAWETPAQESDRRPDRQFPIPNVGVDELKKNLGLIAERFYAMPSAAMRLAAVTGTNGKTSVSHFIAQLAAAKWGDSGLIGTMGHGRFGQLQASVNTTPDALTIHRVLADLYRAGVRHAALEASSHGLVQNRLAGVRVDAAVLTNLGHDHLDYHGSAHAYADAKMKLFTAEPRMAVLNMDDDFSQRIAQRLPTDKIIYYSAEGQRAAAVRAQSIQSSSDYSSFTVQAFGRTFKTQIKAPGRFNVANALAALAVLYLWDLPLEEAGDLLSQLNPVTGRMQVLKIPDGARVIIDYAHTAEALDLVLEQCRAFCSGRLYCVFGCGGDRDKSKRALMGQAASRWADYVVLSNDNPRYEDPHVIMDDVQHGLAADCDYRRLPDRRQAIAHVLERAERGDCIVIAGKGHEEVQIVGDSAFPCNDADMVRSLSGASEA